MSFNHDEMMFAPASRGKAAFLHRSIHSADVADLDGWLIGGWTAAVYNNGLFEFELYFQRFGGQRVAVSQLNHAINDVPSHNLH